jgi:sRNA-binding regulator protein Hfq
LETRITNSYFSLRNDPNKRPNNNIEPAHRRLIRPSLTEFKEQQAAVQAQQQQQQHRKSGGPGGGPLKRPVPPEQTNAENFYYVKQMQAKTPMVIVLADGEELHGVIEWYDRGCLKVHRTTGPNLLIYKANIKYLYKESDKDGAGS